MKKTVLEIDLNALEHNFNVISSKLKPSTKFMAVVKAGGYGSDSVEIAKKLESIGVDYFAVAFTNEGIDLRKAGIKTPILVLLPQVESIKDIVDYNLEASLYSFYFLENFVDYVNEKKVKKCFCHFKINTDMNSFYAAPIDEGGAVIDPTDPLDEDYIPDLVPMDYEFIPPVPEDWPFR